MQIDQSNLLDSLSKNSSSEVTSKGIANYIQNDNQAKGVFAQSSFGGKTECYTKTEKTGAANAVTSINMADATYQKPIGEEDKQTFADTLAQNDGTSAEERKNQMAVIANTSSPEDLQKMAEDGFSATETDSHTVITEMDKIKAVLAKAGVDISIYGDDLSVEQMTEITGSMALAQQLESQLKQQDLPVTSENTQDMVNAYMQVTSMTEVSEDAIAYLLKNHLAPTIDNLYRAQFCGTNTSMAYQQEQGPSDADLDAMQEQIKQIVEEAGLTADEDTLKVCKWLIKNDIALTGENITYAKELHTLDAALKELAVCGNGVVEENGVAITEQTRNTQELIINAMAQAIAEGQRPEDAMLIEGYSLMDQAENAMKIIMQTTTGNLEYCVQKDMEINIHNLDIAQRVLNNLIVQDDKGIQDDTNIENDTIIQNDRNIQSDTGIQSNTNIQNNTDIQVIKAQRQIAEIRLTMTVSANYSLLKKGIAIDIQPLEQLIEELKEQENQYYRDLLGHNGVEVSAENVQTFADTTTYLQELQSHPAYILSPMSAEDSIRTMHASGSAMQQSFEKANQSYEMLMTQPSEDYNDDISKAFQNIDDILNDLDLEVSRANQRAVRILAYNETPLTVENIQRVKAADEQVQRAFSNMTPAVTLEMIRRNINPLDISIEELNVVAEEIKETTQDKNEKFSKFLWKLEKNNEITEEERTSYIGIYRLIAQVEKTDGAVIGSLLNQGADVTMRNLLQAVRSKNKGKMDYTVDDELGSVKTTIIGEKIDQQIEAAYQLNCLHDVMDTISPEKLHAMFGENWEEMTPEQLKQAFEMDLTSVQEESYAQKQNYDYDYEYAKEQLKDFQEAALTPEEVYSFMERYDIQNSIVNVLASSRMMKNPNIGFRDLFDKEGLPESAAEMIEQMKETVLEEFGEAVKKPQEMADAQKTLAEVAEHVLDTAVMEKETIQAADLKRLRLMNSQFQLCAQKAKEESFLIPVQTGDSVSGISLKIVRGKEEKGFVDIFFRGALMGKVAASFEAKEHGISGTIAVSDEESRKLLAEQLQVLADSINEDGNEAVDLRVACIPELSQEQFEISALHKEERIKGTLDSSQSESSNEAEKNPVQTKRLYHIAESFIQLIGELTN